MKSVKLHSCSHLCHKIVEPFESCNKCKGIEILCVQTCAFRLIKILDRIPRQKLELISVFDKLVGWKMRSITWHNFLSTCQLALRIFREYSPETRELSLNKLRKFLQMYHINLEIPTLFYCKRERLNVFI